MTEPRNVHDKAYVKGSGGFIPDVDGVIENSHMAAGAIKTAQLATSGLAIPLTAMANPQLYDPGRAEIDILRIASDVVDQETVTIGGDVYEVQRVATDSTDDTAGGFWNNTTNPLTIADISPYTVIDPLCVVNALIAIGTEILKVTARVGNAVTFQRAQYGTTAAAHANAQNILVPAQAVAAGHIPVGLISTLTPTAFTPVLKNLINSTAAYRAVSFGAGFFFAYQISVNELLVVSADAAGGSPAASAAATAVAETLGGTNNAWANTTFYGGRVAGARKSVTQTRVPKAAEVTLGTMHFLFDFTPVTVLVFVIVTATPGIAVAWDGGITIAAGHVSVDNAGSTDWSASHTLIVIATD